jgi:isoquinoline 1-oxidoreductase beta subunit
MMRVELPGKVNGTARYSIDLRVPNMLYGTVLRALKARSPKIEETKAKAIAGVVRVVRLPYGVDVLAETP